MNDHATLPDIEDPLLEDFETQLNKVADQLSELSNVEVWPVGYKSVNDPFEPSEVDFSSSSWLLRVLQVQAWLHPDAEVDARSAERDPKGVAQELFKAISAEDILGCIEYSNGLVRLTVAGAEFLASRLDTAVSLQSAFTESLESLSRKQATAQWSEAWEEEAESGAPAPEPITAKSDIWRINDFSGKASRGILNLNPSYQRGDVWPTSDAQKLIESILRGIPLPSIILLKPRGANQTMYEVVDGKQRLTSILRFIGQHPQALERVRKMDGQHPALKLLTHFHSDYKKFRRLWKNAAGESLTDRKEAEYYFPFRLAQNSKALQGPLASLAGKYFCDVRDELIHVGGSQETVSDVFERASDYKIPLIEYLDASPKQIHEVFHLYNRQGKHLNAEEIRNALFHDVDLVRLVLVASGDNPAAATLAPYFPKASYQLLKNISKSLDDYRFGTARYKRTKMLSWLYSLMFQPSVSNGDLSIRSTAKQIDTFLATIRASSEGAGLKLAQPDALVQLIKDTERCLEAHSTSDCWESGFKDDDRGQKWQELQLIASLVAVFLLSVVEESPEDVLEKYRTELLEFTKNHHRPEKTQNKTQWGFIGEVALGILEVVGVDFEKLESVLIARYGVSCLQTLQAAKIHFQS